MLTTKLSPPRSGKPSLIGTKWEMRGLARLAFHCLDPNVLEECLSKTINRPLGSLNQANPLRFVTRTKPKE